MENRLTIDGYEFYVDDRRLEIRNEGLQSDPLVSVVFTPVQAHQLALMLNKLVPDNFGVRNHFRVPLLRGMKFKTRIGFSGREHDVVARSLSQTGAFVLLPEGLAAPVVGHELQIAMMMEGFASGGPAQVTRVKKEGVGIEFAIDSWTKSERDHLNALVMAAQRKWISFHSSGETE